MLFHLLVAFVGVWYLKHTRVDLLVLLPFCSPACQMALTVHVSCGYEVALLLSEFCCSDGCSFTFFCCGVCFKVLIRVFGWWLLVVRLCFPVCWVVVVVRWVVLMCGLVVMRWEVFWHGCLFAPATDACIRSGGCVSATDRRRCPCLLLGFIFL